MLQQNLMMKHVPSWCSDGEELEHERIARQEKMSDLEIVCRALMIQKRQIEEKDKLRNWRPPFDGQDIMRTFDMRPCKDIGIIKDAVCDAILDGEIENSRAAALQRMIEEGEKLGYPIIHKPEELL